MPEGRGKNIVLCFDGTDNNFNRQYPTNVLKLFKMLENNNTHQLCYYQPGIGNDIFVDFDKKFWGIRRDKLRSRIDAMLGVSLDYHVIQAYTYLMNYYDPGDKLYIFGFSRGSFTGRILAGLIGKIGLLNRGLDVMVPTAWQIYQKWELDGQPLDTQSHTNSIAVDFKKTFCREFVSVELMGLWDSVCSCGIIRDRIFPYTSLTYHIKHIRHAVSINEKRAKFKNYLFNESLNGRTTPLSEPNIDDFDYDSDNGDSIRRYHCLATSPDMLEMWFPGDHSDVGGAWPNDLSGHALSNIPLRWMLSYAAEYGVIFKEGSLKEFSEKFPVLDSVMSCHHNCLCLIRHMPVQHEIKRKMVFNDSESNMEETEGDFVLKRGPVFVEPSANLSGLPKSRIKKFDCRGDDTFWTSLLWWATEFVPFGNIKEESVDNPVTGNSEVYFRSSFTPNIGRERKVPLEAKVHWSMLWRARFIEDQDYSNVPESYKKLFDFVALEGSSSINSAELQTEVESDNQNLCSLDRTESFNHADVGNASVTVSFDNYKLINYRSGEIRIDQIDDSDLARLRVEWQNIPEELSDFI